jgi:hypothetical protein
LITHLAVKDRAMIPWALHPDSVQPNA